MLKTVLFASVAVSALCLGPTFGWPTQLPNSLSHDMSIDTISTGKALGAGKSTALSMSQTSAVEQPGAKKRKVNNDDDNDSVVTSTSQPATSGTATTSQTSAVAQSGAKKRKVSVDDDNESEDAVAVVAQDAPESHPFKIILMVDDVNTLFSDVLDLKSYLALAIANKNVHVRKVITDKIMSKDLRALHHIQWENGPAAGTFLNYLFNRTVWEAKREVFRNIQNPTNNRLQATAPLARKIARLASPRLSGPSPVKTASNKCHEIFERCYRLLNSGRMNSVSTLPYIYKPVTASKGVNLGERGMAFFMEHLIRLGRIFTAPKGQTVASDWRQSAYYDAPMALRCEAFPSPERRSVVERFESSKDLKLTLGTLPQPLLAVPQLFFITDPNLSFGTVTNPTEERKAQIYAQLFKDDILFHNSELLAFMKTLCFLSENRDENLDETFYQAINANKAEIIDSWTPDQLRQTSAEHQGMWVCHKDIKYLRKEVELRELYLDKVGDNATRYHFGVTADAHYQLWMAKRNIANFRRYIELRESELTKLGNEATALDFKTVALAYKILWEQDKTKILYLERAAELFDFYLAREGDAVLNMDLSAMAATHRSVWLQKKTIKNLERSAELYDQILAKWGNMATVYNFGDAARAHREMWTQKKTIKNLERSAALYDQILTKLGNAASADTLNVTAYMNRMMWQLDSQKTHCLLKAISLVDRRHEMLRVAGPLRSFDILVKAWYALQHSRIELAQSLRREEAKSLWQQALQMGVQTSELESNSEFLNDLNAEFGERTPEDL